MLNNSAGRVAEEADRLLGGQVKDYMVETGEIELHDGEAEIVAILQRRTASGWPVRGFTARTARLPQAGHSVGKA